MTDHPSEAERQVAVGARADAVSRAVVVGGDPEVRVAIREPSRRRRRSGPSAHTLLHTLEERGGPTQPLSSPEVMRRDALVRRSLAAGDVIAAAVAAYLAISLNGDVPKIGLFAVLPLVVLVGKVSGLYDADEDRIHKSTLDEAPALFQAATLYALLVWLSDGALVNGSLTRVEVVELWLLLIVVMVLARACARRIVVAVTPPERCLVVGHEAAADRLRTQFEASHRVKAEVVGCISLVESEDGGVHVQGGVRRLADAIATHRVQRVIIAPTGSDPHTLDAIRLVKSLGLKVSVLPRLFEVVGSSVRFDNVDGLILLGVPRYGLTTSSAFVKRSLDVFGAAAGLVVLSPLLAFIALAVKLDSRGPVLFRQPRIGRRGREFTLLKFRTMVDGAEAMKPELAPMNEAHGLFKIAEDPRVTRVGAWLRRASLDELPQLVNVLRGEMSLVGPRPLVPDEDCRVEGWQRRRLMVWPGMTGVWQLLGYSRVPLQEMVKLDYLYTANWSVWLDTKILLRTLLHVAQRRGL